VTNSVSIIKKSIHFTLLKDTHSSVRIECFKAGVSMQEFFEEVSQRLAAQDLDMIEIMQDISMKKRQKTVESLSKTDAESIYDAIEGASQFLDTKKNV